MHEYIRGKLLDNKNDSKFCAPQILLSFDLDLLYPVIKSTIDQNQLESKKYAASHWYVNIHLFG